MPALLTPGLYLVARTTPKQSFIYAGLLLVLLALGALATDGIYELLVVAIFVLLGAYLLAALYVAIVGGEDHFKASRLRSFALAAQGQWLEEIFHQIRASADSVLTSARGVSASSAQLSQRAEAQAATLEQTASSMEELAATVKQNSDSCAAASTLASRVNRVAVEGAESVSRVVETMQRVESSAKKMLDITAVIEGIAFQTNILALNAAVEAARAGSHGAGFAVVASEVRTLAQRSAQAAKQIKGLLDESADSAVEGSKLAVAAAKTIDTLVESMNEVSEHIGEIADASTQQSAGVDEVSHAIVQMDDATQQNAMAAQHAAEAAAAFEELARKLRDITATLDRIDDRDKAVALVRRGIAQIQTKGLASACDDFDNPRGGFIFGEFYLWVIDLNGVRLAYGANPSTRGQCVLDVQDVDGHFFFRNIIDKAQRDGRG